MTVFSSLSATAATDSYFYSEEAYDGNVYTKAIINGINEYDEFTNPNMPVHYLEVGTTLSLEVPTAMLCITDSN